MWAKDIIDEHRDIIFYVVDHRIMLSPHLRNEAVAGFQYLVDLITDTKYPSTFFKENEEKGEALETKSCLSFVK